MEGFEGRHEGPHINYIAVGMLAKHYWGDNVDIEWLVHTWNELQVQTWQGDRNREDIGPGTMWAKYGAAQYDAQTAR